MTTSLKEFHELTGTQLQLGRQEITAFIHGSICPLCHLPKIIHRTWRKDYLCGDCLEIYKIIDSKVHLIGNQKELP